MSLKFQFCQLSIRILLNISRTINHRNELVMGKWYSEVGRHCHGVTGKLYYIGSCYIEGSNILSYTVFLYLHCLSFQQNKSFQRLVFGICETDGRLKMLSSTIFKDYWNRTPRVQWQAVTRLLNSRYNGTDPQSWYTYAY